MNTTRMTNRQLAREARAIELDIRRIEARLARGTRTKALRKTLERIVRTNQLNAACIHDALAARGVA